MTLIPAEAQGASRRIVLIDLDWQEADFVPELLRQPGINVSLVAGESDQNAGVRVAELCGLPHTVELADLTREIFDLALVGEHSARRTQVERLLTALGTPISSPQAFFSRVAPNAVHDMPDETESWSTGHEASGPTDRDNLDATLARALPDLSATSLGVMEPSSSLERAGEDDLPAPDDRFGLDRALARWVQDTSAAAAELHAGTGDQLELACRNGAPDPLLTALVNLAHRLGTPHVVVRLDGPDRGRAWGAWPFRTRGYRGVLAAAGVEPVEGRAAWEQAVQSLRVSWEKWEHESTRDEAGFAARMAWLEAEQFRSEMSLAVERNRRDGIHAAAHRLHFADASVSIEIFCGKLPGQLRDSDRMCRPTPRDVLILHGGPPASFAHVRRRLVALWEEAWRQGGHTSPAPPITEERVELVSGEDSIAFLATPSRWLKLE
jgi:hypothetical protein